MKKSKKAAKKSKAKKPAKAKAKKLKAKVKPKKKAKPAKAKKSSKKAASKAKKKAAGTAMSVIPPAGSILLGRVEDFYAHINVVALTLQKPLRVGDRLNVLGHTTNIDQRVDSMQINHQSVSEAKPKDAVGIKVQGRARKGDYVFTF